MAIDRSKGLAQLNKMLKGGGIYNLSEQKPLEILPTGVATFDAALGCGGFVRGSQNIFYGQPSAGKSALAYTAIANMQRNDSEAVACIIDIERSANKDWLEKFGIDTDRIYIVQEPTIEDAVNAFQECMRNNVFDMIVIDSLGAVIRAVDLDGSDGKGGDANKAQVGGSSRVITGWVNKANGELTKLDMMETAGKEVIKPVIIYINQVRDVIGSRFPMQTMPGGNALKHMAGTITKVSASNATADRKMGTVEGKQVMVGTRVTCTIEKNKYAPARRQGGYDFCYEACPEWTFGVDSVVACYDLAIERGIIEAKGAWAFYKALSGQDVKANGRAAFCVLMRDNQELYDEIYARTMDTYTIEAQEVLDAQG